MAGGDLRAGERTYQLLHQVAGRAGRETRPGRVWVQTLQPEHPLIKALINWDRDGFLQEEKNGRVEAGMPPFGKLVALIISSKDEILVRQSSAFGSCISSIFSRFTNSRSCPCSNSYTTRAFIAAGFWLKDPKASICKK